MWNDLVYLRNQHPFSITSWQDLLPRELVRLATLCFVWYLAHVGLLESDLYAKCTKHNYLWWAWKRPYFWPNLDGLFNMASGAWSKPIIYAIHRLVERSKLLGWRDWLFLSARKPVIAGLEFHFNASLIFLFSLGGAVQLMFHLYTWWHEPRSNKLLDVTWTIIELDTGSL